MTVATARFRESLLEIHDRETRALLKRGRFEDALARLRAEDTGAERESSPAPLCLRLGALLTDLGRYDEARAPLKEAARSPMAPVRAVARAYLALIQVHATGNRNAIQSLLDAAVSEAGLGPARAHVLHVRAVARIKAGNLARAVDDLVEAGRIYRREQNEVGRAALLDTLGQCFELKGRPERAVASYARSIVKKALNDDRLGMAITLGNLGRLNLRLGYFDDALECLEDDLALSLEIGDRRGEVRMKADIARTLLAAGRLEEADAALDEALRAAKAHGGPRDEMLVRKERAEWHLTQGDPDSALQEINRADSRISAAGTVSRAAGAMLQALKGKTLVQAGKLKQGIALLRQAVVVFNQRAVRSLYVEVLRDLALAYQRADLKANALRCCHQALRVGRRIGFAHLVHRLEEDLRGIGRMQGIVKEHVQFFGREAPPDAIGGYERIAELGRGGFGVVYKALDRRGDRVVAVKKLDLGAIHDTRQREWRVSHFLREAELASRVNHPCVAQIHAQDQDDDGNLLLVMDYVEGEPLDARLRKGPLTLPELFALARGVVGALQAVHGAGVLHRDLKPANVILEPDGRPVIVDFGIALLFDRRGKAATDVFSGTLPYAAPEQLGGRRLTPATDLYALGVILYEAATGKLPVTGATSDPENWRRAKIAAKIPPPHAIGSGIPGGFSRLVQRLLAPRPGRRPRSADAVMDALATGP
jgi:tetratricopeptide (TPR) repeat protein/tRNA A-37 threonylcarbamoyl transferase component Bud32